MSERIDSFRDLKVYGKAFELQREIFEITKGFPREEKYSLSDQVKDPLVRSARIYLKPGKKGGTSHIS